MAERDATSVRVEVLGPLRLLVGGLAVHVPGPKRRAALALLALAEGRMLTVDALVNGIWRQDDAQPGRAAVHTHVSRLRAQLGAGAGRLHTMPDGYRLDLDGEFDLAEARTLLSRARACAEHDQTEALDLIQRADQLWRGPALADLDEHLELELAATQARRLHTEVTEALIETAVTVGRPGEVLARAVSHLAGDPLREQAALALMRTLAADGSPAEALQVSREYRERLAEETGLDPSAALGDLEGQIARGAFAGGASSVRSFSRPATAIIGRTTEVQHLRHLLDQERLIALVGPGGVGKTRVALEVGSQHEGAVVVPLAPITDAAAIPHALAAALGLSIVRGDTLDVCLAFLADRRCLLVIDNCEHVLEATRDIVHALLTRCPEVRILATSREPLGLTAERVVRLGPLALPSQGEDPRSAAAVQVFLDRAARACPEASVTSVDELRRVSDIVRRLDGMPLAIELAAGRLGTLSLPDLHARLDRALDLLGDGRPSSEARHRTLRATLEWSYRLLNESEQRLFRQLAVFADGFDLQTVEEIAARLALGSDPAVVLARLVDASIVQVDSTRARRYRMLETLRMFGRDRLAEAGEQEQARRLLVQWARDTAVGFEEALMSADEARADAGLRREFGNLRAAWHVARAGGYEQEAAEIVIALFDVVAYRDLVEVRQWAAELADDPSVAALARAAAVLGTAAEAAYQGGDHDRAVRLAQQGLELANDARDRWYCVVPLAVVALARGDHQGVVSYALAAAALGRRLHESLALAALATAYSGDVAGAQALIRDTPPAASPTLRAWRDYVDGEISGLAGVRDSAELHYQEAIDGARESGATFVVGIASVGLLSVRAASGRLAESLDGYGEVIAYFASTGNWTHLWVTLRNLSRLLREHGDDSTADLLDAAAAAAPDAPAADRPGERPPSAPLPGRDALHGRAVLGREAVLQAAQAAIHRLGENHSDRST